MTSVVFVHGTGVRGAAYATQFERVRAAVQGRSPDVAVLPCLWGDALGARLGLGGASVPRSPGERTARESGTEGPSAERAAEREWAVNQWALLDADPVHELRLTALEAERVRDVAPFAMGPGQSQLPAAALADRARGLTEHPALAQELTGLGLLEHFEDAVPVVLSTRAAQDALRSGTAADLAAPLARAFLAQALRCSAAAETGPAPVIEARRERLVTSIVELLGGAHLGVGSALAMSGAKLAWRWFGAAALERRRDALVDGTHPMAGDILLYLSRGRRIRRFIEDCCRQAPPPVVVLAHSLGGIAALDLLVERALPEVERLVTVGSQAPFLYEVDALPSLAYGDPLPPTVPAWTNVFDPRDMLAYVGEGVFPGRVTDVRVPSGNPFPAAHSDYFGNPDFFDVLAGLVS